MLEQILSTYPGADLFTAVDALAAPHRHILGDAVVHTSFIQRLPRSGTGYWYYIPLMPLAFERFDLSAYDLIISNSHTAAKGVRVRDGQVHVCYLETPMRFAWDLEDYYLDRFRLAAPLRPAARAVLSWLRRWDATTASRVNAFVAVSKFVAARARRCYGREAPVLYPPVDVDFYSPGGSHADFYLAASRLTPFKHVDVIVRAFAAMPHRRLIVIGDGPERKRIEAMATPNVNVLGYQPDDVLRDHMRRARAFLFAAPEDFGIVMAEAHACETPVIAYARGGAAEIVSDLDGPEPNGCLFASDTPDGIRAALDRFELAESRISAASCRASAMRFTAQSFRAGLGHHVESALRRGAFARV